jgi:hypothetical protein
MKNISGDNMKKYVLIGLCLVIALMISSCKPARECGNSICSAEKGETSASCPVDCKESPSSQTKDVLVSISPASIDVKQGDNVTLEVVVSDVANLFGFQFDVSYNKDVLEFQNAQRGTFLNNNNQDNNFCVDYKPSPGYVKNLVCIRFGGAGVNGNGLLETINFKAIANGESDIVLANLKLANPKAGIIEVKSFNGKVFVK